eukprot:symbB.v1.2.025926.t1/scaffold2551.1/size76478/12
MCSGQKLSKTLAEHLTTDVAQTLRALHKESARNLERLKFHVRLSSPEQGSEIQATPKANSAVGDAEPEAEAIPGDTPCVRPPWSGDQPAVADVEEDNEIVEAKAPSWALPESRPVSTPDVHREGLEAEMAEECQTAQGVKGLRIAPGKGVETGRIRPGHAKGADQGEETTGQTVVAETEVLLEKIGESRSAFEKKALVPTFPPEEHRELRIREVKPVAGATARASKDKEAASMRTFDERCLVLYNDLLGMDQEMEITHMLSGVPGGSWGEAFADLTRPKRASTGLIYVRMMEDYLKWHKKQQESAGGDKVLLPSCKDVFWLYLHHVKTDRVGKYSPKAAHLALRYFADCFGFSDEAVTYRRVKKLVENCSKLEEPRNQAEMIPDAQSKTGARPWVASYLGVTEHSDDWMAILVQLLLEVHGAAWKSHDHTGKSFTSDGRNSKTAVASFQQDVTFVRALLVDAVEKGLDIGLTREQAAGLRWHGAKSTLTSFMMHCKVGSRAVRFAGNWKDQRESMPDTYLREAQLMVLDAQEEVPKYIRGGGFVATLEGLPLCAGASLGPEESESKEYQEALEDIDRIRKAAPKPTGLESKDVARAVLDEVASNGGDELEKQLELEKITVVDPSSVEAILDEAFESKPADSPAEQSEEAGDDSSD